MKSIAEIQLELEKNAAERKELDTALERARKAGRKVALAEIIESIDKAGLTIEDVAEAYTNRNSRITVKTDGGVKVKKPRKYQDPISKKTWNGVGKPPKWLVGNKVDYSIKV